MRSVLLVSLVLNAALAVALLTWMGRPRPASSRNLPAVNAASINTNLVRIVKTNVLVRPRAFTWQEVESPDYAVYVQNLRELGMPENTIRDIIIADVDQLFRRRKREQDVQQDFEWWRATPSPAMQSNLNARAQALESERTALLDKLLGSEWRQGTHDEPAAPIALTGPVLGNLSEELKQTVRNVAAQAQARVTALLSERRERGEGVSEAELARIREETRQQLTSILSPQQLEEFLLRYSENANRLRRELAGIEPTPEEFRALFRSVDAIDREIQLRYSGDDAASQRARQALELQRQAALRNALGADRFAEYRTTQDPAYREAVAVAQQVGGDEETARALYEIQLAMNQEANRIRTDPNLTEAQRQQQLRAAEIEQLQARALVLGEPAPDPVAIQPQVPAPRPHVMEPFDTLGRLSLRYGVRISELREANPGVDINRLPPGSVINIPPQPSVEPPLPPAPLPPGLVPRR